jgi:hypothetical protein
VFRFESAPDVARAPAQPSDVCDGGYSRPG